VEIGISRKSVATIIHKDIQLKCLKKHRTQELAIEKLIRVHIFAPQCRNAIVHETQRDASRNVMKSVMTET